MRGAPSPRPPRMGNAGRPTHIGAPSSRGTERGGPRPVRGAPRHVPQQPMSAARGHQSPIAHPHHSSIPPELALLSDPPKGAERYVHPNSFSTDRGPIIPQSIPQAPSLQAQMSAPPSPRGAMPRHSMAPRRQNQQVRADQQRSVPPEVDPRTGRPFHSGRSSAGAGSPHLTPPINRSIVPEMTAPANQPRQDYRPEGVDPWGLESPNSAVSSSPTGPSLDQSVHAVQEIMSHSNGGGEAIQFVTERLNEIVSYIQSNQSSAGNPSPVFEHLRQFQKQLQAAGIEEIYAEELIEQTKARVRLNQLDKQVILAHLGQVLAHNLKSVNPLTPLPGTKKNVLAFVGPTGVGKTTTIAKIAAHAQLTHELPVTLISTDTFRMAAVEQLSRYASILDCPAKAAHTPEELWRAIDEADTPLVLVDTTGRNPKTQGQLKALSELFGKGWSGRTVLTVAANTREQDLKPIVEGFSPLKYDMVAVTKLDETYALGTVYNVGKLTNCPISWTTNGQRVPEDIELANAEVLAVKIIMEAISNKV